jgi:hypothetical protein
MVGFSLLFRGTGPTDPGQCILAEEVTLRLTNRTMLEPDIAVFPKALFRKSSTGFARLEPSEACLVIKVAVSSLAYDMTETFISHGAIEDALLQLSGRDADLFAPPSERLAAVYRERARKVRFCR